MPAPTRPMQASPTSSTRKRVPADLRPPPADEVKLPPKAFAARASGVPSPLVSSASETTKLQPPKSPSSPTSPQCLENRLQSFRNDWERLLHAEHPNRTQGLRIIDELLATAGLEKPKGIAHYGYVGYQGGDGPDLAKFAQIDLNALEFGKTTVVADQRSELRRLSDSDDIRAALGSGLPIAITVAPSERGMQRATVNVPSHHFVTRGATLAAGQGVFSYELAREGSQAVVTQAVGQCVLLDFPATPENRPGFPPGFAARKAGYLSLFRWARAQPGATLRVLRPGDHVFLPALQARFVISLGYNGSNNSITGLTYVALNTAEDEDERVRKKPKNNYS